MKKRKEDLSTTEKNGKRKVKRSSSVSTNKISREKQSVSKKSRNRLLRELLFDPEEYLKLTDSLKRTRANFSKGIFLDRLNLERVVFSDISKFSLHGSDHLLSWQLEDRPDFGLENHPILGKGILLWGCFFFNDHIMIQRIRKAVNAESYSNLLENIGIPYMKRKLNNNFLLQQPNGWIQKSSTAKEILKKHELTVMRWPRNSKDINPFEEIWKKLSSRVYDGSKYVRVEDLWLRIQREMKSINREGKATTRRLVSDTRRKFLDLWSSRGSRIREKKPKTRGKKTSEL